MRKYILAIATFISGFALAQEIKTDMPTILPPSPTVAALMKFEEIPVSNYTGIPDVSIPLYSAATRSKDISLNLSLSYHPSGGNANERASDVGLGWSLFAGGTISRTVRGIADEYYQNGSTTNKVGIYHTTEPSNRNSYNEYLDILQNGASTPTEQYIEQEYPWEANEKGKYDTEHDLWQYNFMGISGRFIMKKNTSTGLLEVVKMDDSTVKIINTYDTTNTANKFTPISFTIYDDKGNRYEFDVVEVTQHHTATFSYGNVIFTVGEGFYVDPYAMSSSNSPTTYYKSAFHLSRVYDNNNKLVIDFAYNNESQVYKEFVIDETIKQSRLTTFPDEEAYVQGIAEIAMLGGCPDGLGVVGKIEPKLLIVKSQRSTTVKKLKRINVQGKAKIDFIFQQGREDTNLSDPEDAVFLDEIIVRDWDSVAIKKIHLDYNYSEIINKRLILSEVVFSNFQNSLTQNYTLNYKQNTSSLTPSKDYWGYFNLIPSGYMGGSYREVDPVFCSTDVLQKMTLPIGGCAIFDFEANRYSYEGNTALTNFDDNPDNWNHTTVTHNFISTNLSVQNLGYSATEDQKVTFYPTDDFGDDAGISLYKDGNIVASYANIKCPSVIPNCAIEYTLLKGSHYGLKIWSIASGTIETEMNVVYHTRKTVIDSCLYGGGVRIKRIGYFANGTTPQNFYENTITSQPEREKNFNYNFFGTLRSSGSLAFAKPLYTYSIELDPGIHCGGGGSVGGTLAYDVTTDFNNLSPVKTKGADIGYKEVTVSETANGRTEYTYTSPIDYPEPDFIYSTRPPFKSSENFDYKRGLLLKEKAYHNDGRSLTEAVTVYEIDDYRELTGIKFFHQPINCPESFRYIDYDHFKYCTDNSPICNISLGNINCGSDATDFIGNENIFEAFGWVRPKTKTTKNFFYPGGGTTAKTVQVDETYTYHPVNKKISESTVTNSFGEVLKTKYHYHTGNSTYSQNRISEIEKIETYRGTELLSTSQINYANTWAGNASYLPQVITTSKGTASLENRVRFNLYDDFSNPLELQQENGTVVSYLWGYNRTVPIAKIENATNAQIATALGLSNLSTVDEADMIAINALRTTMTGAMITTYTYIPLVGVETITDPKGDKLTYEYDPFGRLKSVKDKSGNTLSENEYHYKN